MANISIDIALTDDTSRKWVYKDIHENMELDPVKRDLSSYYDVGAVNNALINLFRFKKGERQFNMNYGIDIEEYLYEGINSATARAIGDRIKIGIAKWEPRLALSNIKITPDRENNQYNIVIKYSVPLMGNDEYEMNYNLNGNT